MTKSQTVKDPTAAANEMMGVFMQMAGNDREQAREYAASKADEMIDSGNDSDRAVGKILKSLTVEPS